jgi:hypothetical protein
MEILNKLFVALICSILYTLFSFLIQWGLYYIKNKESSLDLGNNYTYELIANAILIFLILLFFKIEV